MQRAHVPAKGRGLPSSSGKCTSRAFLQSEQRPSSRELAGVSSPATHPKFRSCCPIASAFHARVMLRASSRRCQYPARSLRICFAEQGFTRKKTHEYTRDFGVPGFRSIASEWQGVRRGGGVAPAVVVGKSARRGVTHRTRRSAGTPRASLGAGKSPGAASRAGARARSF